MEDHGGSAGPLRSGKMYSFEGGMRVPTVAMWKGTIAPGRQYEDMATQMDWFPTFLELAGLNPQSESPLDGESLVEVLKGRGNRSSQEFLFYEFDRLTGYREGKWKVKLPFRGFDGSPWQNAEAAHDSLLFDLVKDPGERNNLFDKFPAKGHELFSNMEAKRRELGELPPSIYLRSMEDNSHFDYLEGKKREK